jgi:hypothetical protein
MPAPATDNHFCSQCGRPGPFRSAAALRCLACDKKAVIERADYQRDYQRSKAAALKTLVRRHRPEYDELMLAERLKGRRGAKKR